MHTKKRKTLEELAEIRRQNGAKGGRPAGVENEETRLRREAKKIYLKKLSESFDSVVAAQLDLAIGVYIHIKGKKGDIRVYKRPPSAEMNKYLTDQLVGRPTDIHAFLGQDAEPIDFSAELRKRLKQYEPKLSNTPSSEN